MNNLNCPQCGAPITSNDTECRYCGEKLQQQPQYPQQQYPQYPQYQQPQYPQPQYPQYPQSQYPQPFNPQFNNGINPQWPIKNKTVAGVLGILLGSLGIHKFYLGKTGEGILYIIFSFTGVPAILGIIEGITYLCSNDHNFQIKNQVRLG